MFAILEKITGGLDWLFETLVSPVFIGMGHGLDFLVLKPLGLLKTPVALQMVIIAMLTAGLSLAIRALLKVERHEALFQARFAEKRRRQQNIDLVSDLETREAFYCSTDNDIDDDFNTYLAQRFGRHSATYLLPIFLALCWLEEYLPSEKLLELTGVPYALALPANSLGIAGLSVPFVFLTAYAVSLLCLLRAKKLSGACVDQA